MTSQENKEKLKKAAAGGDVNFLKLCAESNEPIQYYHTFFPKTHKRDRCYGNIFHIAADKNREEFIKEAIEMLPVEDTKQLLMQPADENKWNPLHTAAGVGNLTIIKMFLDVYRRSLTLPVDHSERPWLLKTSDKYGCTPCDLAIWFDYELCAVEILKMDMELISNMTSVDGTGLLYNAVRKGHSEVALEILRSPYSFSCSGCNNFTPLSLVMRCSPEGGKEICRLLLEKKPELVRQREHMGRSVLNSWAIKGDTMWPFKCTLDSNDIFPDIKKVIVDLIGQTDYSGNNPIHNLAELSPNEEVAIQIAKLLIDTYEQETSSSSAKASEDQLPWLVHNDDGDTPLSLAISHRYERFAAYILSRYKNALLNCSKNALFLAIKEECHQVVEMILEIIDNQGWTQLLYDDEHVNVLCHIPTYKKECHQVVEKILEIVDNQGWTQLLSDDDHVNVFHHTSLYKKVELFKRLVEKYPMLLTKVDKNGRTVLHHWLAIANTDHVILEYLLQSSRKNQIVKLMTVKEYNDHNNAFHVAATSNHNVFNLLVQAYKDENIRWSTQVSVPWYTRNRDDEGPVHLAIRCRLEELALYILSVNAKHTMEYILDIYMPEINTLFHAIENDCSQVAKEILKRLNKRSRTNYLTDPSDGRSVLHIAAACCTDLDFVEWLADEIPELTTKSDNNEQTPLDVASNVGASGFIKVIMEKVQSAILSSPLAWVKACKKGHVSTVCAFIEHNPGKFRDLCIKHKDSPLHHIQLQDLAGYEEFLKIPRMKDMINLQDSQGATPLHRAILNRNIFLAETLLDHKDKIVYKLKDKENATAIDLLEQVCNEQEEWDVMCQRIGFDPRIKTTYFQREANLIEVRGSLFVVAALLATITFTAGFTLPGGFNQATGEAILNKKAAFIVFLISDALAMCCSMLVLICLIWSTNYDTNKALFLIDRSMTLLMLALYCTLLAFVTGVYVVISPKSLWPAILIIVMCTLVGISAKRSFLYKILGKLIPSTHREPRVRIRKVENMEQGIPEDYPLLSHGGENSNLIQRSTSQPNNE